MVDLVKVNSHIMQNVFYNDRWKDLTDEIKQVVANNADMVLKRELPHHFGPNTEIPVDVIAEQAIYILDQDDSFRRAEMGMSYFFTNGLYISFDKNDANRSIARSILHRYPRRRTARSVIDRANTFRSYGSVRRGDY